MLSVDGSSSWVKAIGQAVEIQFHYDLPYSSYPAIAGVS
jgi:hypothetical protein